MVILDKLKDYEVVLASGSPRRKELLEKMGLKFKIRVSDVEENPRGETPEEIVEGLSYDKAHKIANDILMESVSLDKANNVADNILGESYLYNGCLVIAADTTVFSGRDILGKPADEAEAIKMIGAIQGKKHMVCTGVTVAIIKDNKITYDTFSVKTDVFVAEMDDSEVEYYVGLGESLDKAGAYGVQGAFSMYIEKIDGDYYNVVGLPVQALYRHLKALIAG